MQSVLSRASASDLTLEPFPHLVLPGPLEDALCDRLIEEFPPFELIAGEGPYKSNQRLDYRASKVLGDQHVSPLWRDLVATHVSQAFLDQALALFADPIRETYPSFEREFGQLDELKAGLRHRQTFEEADVLLDAQISVNTPVTGDRSSVRRGHLDAHNKLFVGLLYLRHPQDESMGGELEIYRYATDDPRFTGTPTWSAIEDRQLEVVKTIPYEKNLLVFFLNSRDALHGVTPRSRTPTPRLFLNLVAEVPRPLFDVPLASRPRRRPLAHMPHTRPLARRGRPLARVRRPARWRVLTPAMTLALLAAVWLGKALAHHDYDLI